MNFFFFTILEMIILILCFSVTSLSDGFVKFIYQEMLLKNVKHCQKLHPIPGELVIEILNRLKASSLRPNTEQPEWPKSLLSEVSLFKEQVFFSVESVIVDDCFKDTFHCVNSSQTYSHLYKYSGSAMSYYEKELKSQRKFRGFTIKSALASDALMFQPPYNIGGSTRFEFRRKRYALSKYKWKKRNLTYCITKYAKTLPGNVVDREISRAFRLWTSVTTLIITEMKTNDADILLGFEEEMHGDTVSFDGPGGVLAHTYYPLTFPDGSQRSFVHFDDAEKWTEQSRTGINLFQVALHEIGHALGLKHSSVEGSVMWPTHKGYKINFTLHQDDIRGIRALYGLANMRRT